MCCSNLGGMFSNGWGVSQDYVGQWNLQTGVDGNARGFAAIWLNVRIG